MGMSLNIPITMVEGLLGRTQIYPKKSLHVVAPSSVLGRRKSTLNWTTLHYTITTLLYFGTAVMPKIWEKFSCVFITLRGTTLLYSTWDVITLLYFTWDYGTLGTNWVKKSYRRDVDDFWGCSGSIT